VGRIAHDTLPAVVDTAVKPRLTVVIPVRNGARTIGDQLASLAQQDYAEPWEIVVVDNGSRDDTAAVVRNCAAQLPPLRMVECLTAGVNRARNAGVRAANGELLLVCDADDAVASGWVRGLAVALESFDVVGGLLDYGRFNDPLVRCGRDWVARTALPIGPGGRRYAVGANLGFRRVVYENIGGFDESFRIGSDEIDFCLRAQYEGFTVGLAANAIVHYRLRQGMRDIYRQNYAYATGFAHLHRKHIDLGALPEQSWLNRCKLVVQHVARLARLTRLFDVGTRSDYARDLAWSAGSISGYFRYRILV
jgi:glycosyltransferase involved in cell wall biosynthesis